MTDTLYKVTGPDGAAFHGGKGAWPLPNGRPGKWLTVEGDLVPCENGLHLCRLNHLLDWLGPVIWEAEHSGELVEDDYKVLVRKARLVRRIEAWSTRTARLFAADCAERVLPIADDPRCEAAVLAARLHAFGFIDDAALDDAKKIAKRAAWDVRTPHGTAAVLAASGADDNIVADPVGASWTAYMAAWATALGGYWVIEDIDAERAWQRQRLLAYLNEEVDLDAIRASVSEAHHEETT